MGKKIDRIGETNINNQGLEMKIIEYRRNNDIDVEFLNDGYIKENVQYHSFKNGNIKNPNFKNSKLIDRTGEINYNKFGSKMVIVKYKRNDDIDVYFEEYNWIAKNRYYQNFKIGNITCPYEKSILGVGYLGEGKYEVSENSKLTKCYRTWYNMLMRCYDEKCQEKNPTYVDCFVCDEWLNFQNFAKWYYENYYEIEGEIMCLDKDILVKGNKMYSPKTCIFVPQSINSLFIKRQNDRGKSIIGSTPHHGKYEVSCGIFNSKTGKSKQKYLGLYNSEKEAFEVYKQFKEQYIKEVADYYKEQIPTKLYDALYNYEVEITD